MEVSVKSPGPNRRLWLSALGVGACLVACRDPQYAKLGDSAEGDTDVEAEPPVCPITTPTAPDGVGADDWTAATALQGGDIEQLRVALTDSNQVWAASAQNGIWRSYDAGDSWTAANAPIPHTYGQVALHPSNTEVFAYSSDQGRITVDGGASFLDFTLPWTGTETSVRGIAFDDVWLYAAQMSGDVHRSDDFGQTWEAVGSVPPPSSSFMLISGGHDEKDALWLAVTGSGALLAASTGNGVYRSTDNGTSFTEVSDDPVSGDLLSVMGDSAAVGVLRDGETHLSISADAGETWAEGPVVAVELTSIWLETDGGVLGAYAGGYWSSAGGLVPIEGDGWGRYEAVARAGDDTILVGHRLGILGSTDGAASFAEWSEEMVDEDLINLAVHPVCPGVVFAGTQCRSGLYRSLDYGQTFARVTGGDMHYTMVTAASPSAPADIWSTSDDVLWRSDDLAETWIALSPSLDEHHGEDGGGEDGHMDVGVHLHGLGVHPEDAGRVIVGSVGEGDFADDQARLYSTEDWGHTWHELTEGLPSTDQSFHAIHFVLDDPDIVLLGTFAAGEGVTHAGREGVGLYRSEDAGESWALVDGSPLSVQIFAECDGRIYAGTGDGVIQSRDLGATWETVLGAVDGVKNVACHGDLVLAIDPGFGVQRSDDRGATWTDWTGTLSVTLGEINNQMGLEISPDGRFAYAVVPGRGYSMREL
jgi:hypothetical protein